MVKMTPEEWQQVGEAILVWSGWGRSSWPARNDELVTKRVGRETAATLLPLIRQVRDAFYASDARHTAADLAEMARGGAGAALRRRSRSRARPAAAGAPLRSAPSPVRS